MTKNIVEYPIYQLNKDITMSVRIVVKKEFRIRMWLATRLMQLAAIILRCNMEINYD